MQKQVVYSIEGFWEDAPHPPAAFFITYGQFEAGVWLNFFEARKRSNYSPRIIETVEFLLLALEQVTTDELSQCEALGELPPHFQLHYDGNKYTKRFWAAYEPPIFRIHKIEFTLTSFKTKFKTSDPSILLELQKLWEPSAAPVLQVTN
jgi:hypothetical protein